MLDFKESEVKFKFGGEEHCLRVPNNRDLREYRKDLKSCENDEEKEDLLIDLLVKQGGNKDVIERLTPQQTAKLLEALTGAEKN